MLNDSPLTLPVQSRPATNTRLRGGWLIAARAAWALEVVLCIVLLVASIRPFYENYKVLSPNPDVSMGELLPQDVMSLAALGLSPEFYATYLTVLQVIVAVIFMAAGVLIFWRRSDDRVALLFAFNFVATFVSTGPLPVAIASIHPVWDFIFHLLQTISNITFVVALLVFPDGRFVPRWSRWLALVWAGYCLVSLFYAPLRPFLNQPSQAPGQLLLMIWTVAWIALTLGAIVYRYRRVSSAEQRQQTKWIVFGTVFIFSTLVLALLPTVFIPALRQSSALAMGYRLVAFTIVLVSESMIPVAIVFSLSRYRLWDIDYVINRSLVYGGLTLLLGGIFVIAFVLLKTLWLAILGPGQEVIAAVMPAVFVALIFSPTYKMVRRLVDQRLYGIKLDYVGAVKAYGGTKREPQRKGGTRDTFGSYTDLSLLGRGGMGEVYRAQHPTLNRMVAIKILPPHAETDADAHKRFQREAQMVAQLKHPNIVTLHDVGTQDEQPYMVMEFIDGPDLSTVLQQRGRLPLAEALPLLQDVAAALDYAHSQGIVHRDIKPSNIMIEHITGSGQTRTNRAVLMDFGIAKSYAAATRLTQSGMIGTLDYISPEQIQGASEVDGRADIYSFGVMVYQVLTGEMPFKHNNPGAMVLAHLMQPPPDPRQLVPDLPEEAAEAIMRAMAKKPEQRFATVGDFMTALASASLETTQASEVAA